MYSKEENQKLKHQFWIDFATTYPKKWLLYDTKIKDFAFKFYVDNKKAQVSINIEHRSETLRLNYFNKIQSLKNILEDEFIKDLIYEKNFTLENGKRISRIWIENNQVSVSNKNNWQTIFDFFSEKMTAFESFYTQYDEYIKDIES